MKVAILPGITEIARVAADRIQSVCASTSYPVLGLATGSSPLPLYDELIARHRAGALSLANARSFNLDEYVGLPADHPERYITFIRQHLTDQVDIPDDQVQGPDGLASDLDAAANAYDAAIEQAGGIDLQILGIGADGHIGFNEPGGSLASRTHVGFLTERTRSDNARFFNGDIEAVPTRCITQGLGTIMEARSLVLIATGASKAAAVHQMVEVGVSALWPASIMQFHNDALVLVDEDAASELVLADYYRELWAREPATD